MIEQLDFPGPVEPTGADLRTVEGQLGRLPRGVVSVAHRCPCGCPTVVQTEGKDLQRGQSVGMAR